MKRLTIFFSIITLLLLLTCFGIASGQTTGDELIFPDKEQKIKVVQSAGPSAGLEEVKTDPRRLQSNIGPELWVTSKTVSIRRALWIPEPKVPFTVSINTAGLTETEVFLGREKAVKFIEKRRELGFFSSLEQAKGLGFEF